MFESFVQLNKQQQEAVTHGSGPLLIVAGAGTGKTTVLINRLLYLLLEQKIEPQRILLVTFTDKATAELTERADKLLPYGYFDLHIHTFHGLGETILRAHGLDLGLSPDYRVINQTEGWILIKNNLDKFDLDYYRPLGSPDKFIAELVKHFSRLKDENISPQEYLDYALSLKQDQDAMLSATDQKFLDSARINELANAYHVYNQLLLDNKLLDFGDLITYSLRLLQQRPLVLRKYQEQFRYLLVDEFQDTNWVQYELIKLLASPDNNLTVVGDDNQSIFRFRGAALSNILQFQKDYPRSQQVVLADNYRSGQEILDRAYQLIKHNDPNTLEAQLGINKKIQAVNPPVGGQAGSEVKYLFFPDLLSETKGVVELIKNLHVGEISWSDMAILVRANNTAERFLQEAKLQHVPCQFVASRGLYFKPVIMDLLAYLRLLDNYHEPTALLRVLALPQFFISHQELLKLNQLAKTKLWSLYQALEQALNLPDFSAETKTSAQQLITLIKEHSQLARSVSAQRVLVRVVQDCWLPYLNPDQDLEAFNYLNQLYKKLLHWLEAASPNNFLTNFLQLVDLELSAGDSGQLAVDWEDADTVKLLTVHSAKGLEFAYVFVADMVDKKFPTINRNDAIPLPDTLCKEFVPVGDTHLEEERRLCYVAMTRAKRGLYLTGAKYSGGVLSKKPSRFIDEAGVAVMEIKTAEIDELRRDLEIVTPSGVTISPSFAPSVIASPAPSVIASPAPSVIASPAPSVIASPAGAKQSHFDLSKIDKFSLSGLMTFANCPWQYYYQYVLQVPVLPEPRMVFGKTIHTVLQQWLQPLLTPPIDLFGPVGADKLLTLEKLEQLFKELWTDAGYRTKDEAQQFQQKGKKILQSFFASWSSASGRTASQTDNSKIVPQILYLEKKFSWRLNDYFISGVIDRVDQLPDGRVELWDYKASSRTEKLDYAAKRQLLLYQAAWQDLAKTAVAQDIYYYLDNDTQMGFAATPAELERVKTEILDLIAQICAGNFQSSKSHDSDRCPYCQLRQTNNYAS